MNGNTIMFPEENSISHCPHEGVHSVTITGHCLTCLIQAPFPDFILDSKDKD
jgi:hypothetical protein